MKSLKPSNVNGFLIGVLISLITCPLLVAVISSFVLEGRIGEQGTEIGINISVLLAAGLGSWVFARLSGMKPMVYCLLLPTALFLVMLIAALTMGGQLNNVVFRILALIVGGAGTYAISINRGRKGKIQKRRYR